MSKKILTLFGFISLGLGLIGSVLPLLPTTPFLLLAAYFFSKSSDKWYQWLINLPKIGGQIKSWNEHGIISKSSKFFCLISIIGVITWITIFTNYNQIIKTIIPITLITLLSYILTRPSTKKIKTDE